MPAGPPAARPWNGSWRKSSGSRRAGSGPSSPADRVNGLQDIRVREVGTKKYLDPLLKTYGIRANSDYFPVLDQLAARARYLGTGASSFLRLQPARSPTCISSEDRARSLWFYQQAFSPREQPDLSIRLLYANSL